MMVGLMVRLINVAVVAPTRSEPNFHCSENLFTSTFTNLVLGTHSALCKSAKLGSANPVDGGSCGWPPTCLEL